MTKARECPSAEQRVGKEPLVRIAVCVEPDAGNCVDLRGVRVPDDDGMVHGRILRLVVRVLHMSPATMRRLWRNNGLSIVLFICFAGLLYGQAIAGYRNDLA